MTVLLLFMLAGAVNTSRQKILSPCFVDAVTFVVVWANAAGINGFKDKSTLTEVSPFFTGNDNASQVSDPRTPPRLHFCDCAAPPEQDSKSPPVKKVCAWKVPSTIS